MYTSLFSTATQYLLFSAPAKGALAMFFKLSGLKQRLLLKPGELGQGVIFQKALVAKLLEEVGKVACTEEHGFIVTVTSIDDVSDGLIRADTSSVLFSVYFTAIVLQLHIGEVVVVEVENVTDKGCLCTAGPAQIFVPVKLMPGYYFDSYDNAFTDVSDGSKIIDGCTLRVAIYASMWKGCDLIYSYIGTLGRDQCGLIDDEDEVSPTDEADTPELLVPKVETQEDMVLDDTVVATVKGKKHSKIADGAEIVDLSDDD